MKDIQAVILLEHKNILEILKKDFDKLSDYRYDDNLFNSTKEEILFKIKVEMARTEGYTTGKISAAQKEPLSIKL